MQPAPGTPGRDHEGSIRRPTAATARALLSISGRRYLAIGFGLFLVAIGAAAFSRPLGVCIMAASFAELCLGGAIVAWRHSASRPRAIRATPVGILAALGLLFAVSAVSAGGQTLGLIPLDSGRPEQSATTPSLAARATTSPFAATPAPPAPTATLVASPELATPTASPAPTASPTPIPTPTPTPPPATPAPTPAPTATLDLTRDPSLVAAMFERTFDITFEDSPLMDGTVRKLGRDSTQLVMVELTDDPIRSMSVSGPLPGSGQGTDSTIGGVLGAEANVFGNPAGMTDWLVAEMKAAGNNDRDTSKRFGKAVAHLNWDATILGWMVITLDHD